MGGASLHDGGGGTVLQAGTSSDRLNVALANLPAYFPEPASERGAREGSVRRGVGDADSVEAGTRGRATSGRFRQKEEPEPGSQALASQVAATGAATVRSADEGPPFGEATANGASERKRRREGKGWHMVGKGGI